MDQTLENPTRQTEFLRVFAGLMPPDQSIQLLGHARLLMRENGKVNLTGLHDPDALAERLFYPSWHLGQVVDFAGTRVVDFGSGGGFPGIPLAQTTDLEHITLLDSVGKKTDFLELAVETLGLQRASVHRGRGEEFLRDQSLDWVVSQAVSPVPRLLKLLAPVRTGFSRLALLLGTAWEKDSEEAREQDLGFFREEVHAYILPRSGEKRQIAVFRTRK